MEKRDKKAQVETFTMIIWVIALLVLVLVVIGFWKGWDFLFSKAGFLPDDLTTAVQACVGYAGQDQTLTDFCKFRLLNIEDKSQYVNCNYIREVAGKTITTVGFEPNTAGCSVDASKFCVQEANKTTFKTIIINGQECTKKENTLDAVVIATYGSTTTTLYALNNKCTGTWKTGNMCIDPELPMRVTDSQELAAHTGQVCCVTV